jgi:hypothetical protein
MYALIGLGVPPPHPPHPHGGGGGGGGHPHGGHGGGGGGGHHRGGGRGRPFPVGVPYPVGYGPGYYVDGGPYYVLETPSTVSVYVMENNMWQSVAENVVPEEADRIARIWRGQGKIVKIV